MNTNPAQTVKAIDWTGKATITFDWKRGGLVIELDGHGKVTTACDDVQIALDESLWTGKDEQRIKNYNITPEEQAAFDSNRPFTIRNGKVVFTDDTSPDVATDVTVVPRDLYEHLARIVTEYFANQKVKVWVDLSERGTKGMQIHVYDGHLPLDADHDAVRGIVGSVPHYFTVHEAEIEPDAPQE